MSIISWNCRGIGSPSTIPNIKYQLRTYKPDGIILYETMTTLNKIEELKYLLGYDFCVAFDREGRRGGIAFLWRESLNCNITNYSLNHIDIEINDLRHGKWRLTGFYGYPEGSRRKASWDFLRHLSRMSNLPWCIIGDFNDILSASEKKGRTERAPWLIHGFRQAVLDAGLVDVHMEGYNFTWFKSLGTDRAVEEKLDRALANNSWHSMFSTASLECLTTTASDHYPLRLSCVPNLQQHKNGKKFRFENSWLVEPEFSPFVHQCWNSYFNETITGKLNHCAEDLHHWDNEHGKKTRKEIEKVRKKLEVARTQLIAANLQYFTSLNRKLDTLLVKDDLYWKQRAKTFWYREGDLNTRFFHAAASARRKTNKIEHLQDVNGTVCRSEEGLKTIGKDYFAELFQKSPSSRDDVVTAVDRKLTVEDNDSLTAPFTIDEFKEATFSMQADKCPRPDGFNPNFYRSFWDMCGTEVFEAGCSWLAEGVFPPNLNSTNIALIPKGNNQESMKDWRPIALCNVLYKVVAKVLANRLKLVLDKCISANQSAFVPGRSILDNAMAAIEIVHYLKSKEKGKNYDAALKLDISKAYDRID